MSSRQRRDAERAGVQLTDALKRCRHRKAACARRTTRDLGDRGWDESHRQRPSPLNRRDTQTAAQVDPERCLHRSKAASTARARETRTAGPAPARTGRDPTTAASRQQTWPRSANPGAATHAFTTKTASPAGRRRTRRPARRGDTSAIRAVTDKLLATPENPATTTPGALPRGRHLPPHGPRSAGRLDRATRGLSDVTTGGARAQGRAATEQRR